MPFFITNCHLWSLKVPFFSFQAQNVLIVIIVAAIANFLVGAVMGPQVQLAKAKGFEGMSGKFMEIIYSNSVNRIGIK